MHKATSQLKSTLGPLPHAFASLEAHTSVGPPLARILINDGLVQADLGGTTFKHEKRRTESQSLSKKPDLWTPSQGAWDKGAAVWKELHNLQGHSLHQVKIMSLE